MEHRNASRSPDYQDQGLERLVYSLLAFAPKRDQEAADMLAACPNRHIWIFGAAGIGISVKRWLEERNYAVYSFCDNDSRKIGTTVDGVPVRSFSALCQDPEKIVLIGIWKYFDEISRQCESAGVRFWDGTLLSGVVFDTIAESSHFICENLHRLMGVCRKLADSRSVEIYIASQVSRIFRERGAMKPYRSSIQYIEPGIAALGEKETVFICGAGEGSAAAAVDNATKGTAEIHLFEPDAENFSKLCRAVGHMPNVCCVESGVGRDSGQLPFCGGMGENATFSLSGNQTAKVVSIDDYAESAGAIPTFITMDIEGWELEALHGAEKTIARHKPKLAVSLYHRASDFVNIPEFILGLRPDYNFYVRHYTDSYSDTVAYFV